MRKALLLAATVLVLAAGQTARAAADPAAPRVDEVFVLDGGQETTIGGTDLRLRFTDVPEDSRCPALVACFWSGQARVTLVATPAGDAPTTVEFNTNPAPGQNVSRIPVGAYAVELISLDPYPQTPDDGLTLDRYRATLTVHAS